jgi:hypothetical protein
MVFGEVLQRFLKDSPVCVMVRATLERPFSANKLNALFQKTAQRQYTRELLFSSVVNVMSLVVCRIRSSVHAAYVKCRDDVRVSLQALYDKLNHLEPALGRELTRHSAAEARTLIHAMKGGRRPLLPGYRCRILDGNHLAGTEHRLGVLRDTGAGALPGLALAVLDPQTMTIDDVIPCEDGHRQECTLLEPLLATAQPRDVFIDDRHFCTSDFLFGLAQRRAFFITRQHAGHLVWRCIGRRRAAGRCATGRVYEQAVILTDPKTRAERKVRRITIRLDQPTRDGDEELHILTNLPAADASPVKVADLYRCRWGLETAFQELTVHLQCEVNTLGYPPASLFAFCVAASSYNILAVVKAALRAAHGEEKVQEEVSNYFLTEEVSGTYRGMMIAVPPPEWEVFQTLTTEEFATMLVGWARSMNLRDYRKHRRGPKKPKQKRRPAPRKHVATARLLQRA